MPISWRSNTRPLAKSCISKRLSPTTWKQLSRRYAISHEPFGPLNVSAGPTWLHSRCAPDRQTGQGTIMDTKQAVGTSRDLHDGKSFWAATPNIVVESSDAPARTDYDVIIIGAGVSGALMAQALAADGRHILVVDRRAPVKGSTLASTAMIQHEIDIPLSQLSRDIGAKKAMRAWQRSAASVDSLGERIASLGLSCQFQQRTSLFLAGDEMGHRALAAEAELRREAQLDAEYLTGAQVKERFGIDRTGAILSPCSASANPAQMTAGLLKAAQQGGVEIVSPLAITAIRETRDGVMVATADGTLLCAADLIACTGYEYLKMMESPLHQVISTWAIASEPNAQKPDWLDDHLVLGGLRTLSLFSLHARWPDYRWGRG
ncbi:NAD(P)/FAD-dependent oxidoreductase [Agrobacterium vitis]|uniref:NAD(P)/FAD-dependent oxidoreductase n=1 Tax=Agrobacterium vitis TaxID=373 RepID=UPI003D29F199